MFSAVDLKKKKNTHTTGPEEYHCEISQYFQPTFREESTVLYMYKGLGIGVVVGIRILFNSHTVDKETMEQYLQNSEEKIFA